MTERLTVWLAAGQDEQLDELVDTGLYMNRHDAIRDGLRHAIASRSDFRTVDDPLTWGELHRWERARETIRLPSGLVVAVDELASNDNQGAVIRRALALLTDEDLVRARR